MASSNYSMISKVMEVIDILKPKSILDIGAGQGKYGMLCKEYVKDVIVDAIDLNLSNKQIYNNIFEIDIRDFVFTKNKYDFCIFIDVLEYISKQEGNEVIKRILSNCETLLLSIPKFCGGSLTEWKLRELERLGNCIIIPDHFCWIVLYSSKDNLNKVKYWRRRKFVKKILYYLPFSVVVRRLLAKDELPEKRKGI